MISAPARTLAAGCSDDVTWLDRQSLAPTTCLTYRRQVQRFCAWLATAPLEDDDPLADVLRRDGEAFMTSLVHNRALAGAGFRRAVARPERKLWPAKIAGSRPAAWAVRFTLTVAPPLLAPSTQRHPPLHPARLCRSPAVSGPARPARRSPARARSRQTH